MNPIQKAKLEKDKKDTLLENNEKQVKSDKINSIKNEEIASNEIVNKQVTFEAVISEALNNLNNDNDNLIEEDQSKSFEIYQKTSTQDDSDAFNSANASFLEGDEADGVMNYQFYHSFEFFEIN